MVHITPPDGRCPAGERQRANQRGRIARPQLAVPPHFDGSGNADGDKEMPLPKSVCGWPAGDGDKIAMDSPLRSRSMDPDRTRYSIHRTPCHQATVPPRPRTIMHHHHHHANHRPSDGQTSYCVEPRGLYCTRHTTHKHQDEPCHPRTGVSAGTPPGGCMQMEL